MQNEQPGIDAPTTLSPSRRTVVAGAAWTIPIIATAVATPLASASADCTDPSNIAWVGSNYGRSPSWENQSTQGYGNVSPGNGMYADYVFRVNAPCVLRGLWFQIDLPYQLITAPPTYELPGTATASIVSTSDYTGADGRPMRRYRFRSTDAAFVQGVSQVRMRWELVNPTLMAARNGAASTFTMAGTNPPFSYTGWTARANGAMGASPNGVDAASIVPQPAGISTGLSGSPVFVIRAS